MWYDLAAMLTSNTGKHSPQFLISTCITLTKNYDERSYKSTFLSGEEAGKEKGENLFRIL